MLYIRIQAQGKRSYVSTGIKILPGHWNNNQVTGPQGNLLNAKLRKKIHDTEVQLLNREVQGETITVNAARRVLAGDSGGASDFFAHCEQVLKRRSGSTYKRYRVEVVHLKEYVGDRLNFADITPQWLTRYQNHLYPAKNWNTTINSFKFIRLVFNDARDNGVTTLYPFDNWKYPRERPPEKDYLTPEEVAKLFTLLDQEPPLELKTVTAFFLLECYAGIRNSDWKKFRVETVKHGHDLIVRTTKTGTQVRLPVDLMPELQRVLDYITAHGLTYNYSLQHTNRTLKAVALAAGISKPLTTHVARHTCASTLLNEGLSERAIAEILGITVKQVQTYAHLSSSKIRNELKRLRE